MTCYDSRANYQIICHGVFPDFLSIDVENMDYDILRSYDLTKNAPKVIDVEVHFKNEEDYVGDKMKELH